MQQPDKWHEIMIGNDANTKRIIPAFQHTRLSHNVEVLKENTFNCTFWETESVKLSLSDLLCKSGVRL